MRLIPTKLNPVDQTVSGLDKNGKLVGDCFPACISSVLGIPLEIIPLFTLRSLQAQVKEADDWLDSFGIKLKMEPVGPYSKALPGAYHLMRGRSPRWDGYYHMVVGWDGKLVHDPHPDKTGIVGAPTHFIYFLRKR